VPTPTSGLDAWRAFDAYPPAAPAMQRWGSGAGGRLMRDGFSEGSDRYRYEPADPTPNIGGGSVAFTGGGQVDKAARESGADVLGYSSEPLAESLIILGQTKVSLRARASVKHADFFLRLCDVGTDGVSINICDALIRVTPETPVEAD